MSALQDKPRTGNRVLDALPSTAFRAFEKARIAVGAGAELVTQGERITHLFFPTTAVCSLMIELSSGDKAETAAVGREGFVGVPAVLGTWVSSSSGVIQVPGEGYRLSARAVLELCHAHDGFRKALFGYAALRLHLASRTVACNAFHSLRQRLSRWLLYAHDYAGADEFRCTHEMLSSMLAATRPRVSQAAGRLKDARLIDYRRGRMRVLDRARLEQAACECYRETKRLFPTRRH